ncbi:MAG: ATP-grasp domain-containing protein [Bdellovibrio sp.]|nr:MAG: ATP-grasp domain-containing protein [Bdellovibrio sp.]
MKKLRVLVLVHQDLIPPDICPSKEEREQAPWKTEYDVVQALKAMKHEVQCVGIYDDLRPLKKSIESMKPHIVFNLLEEFAGESVFDCHVVSYLELLGIHYTGASSRGLLLARDKALSKKILSYHRIPTPQFVVYRRNKKISVPSRLSFPLFVKTVNEEASLGISQESIVKNEEELVKRVKYLWERFGTDVLAETYIDGREFYVGVLGNERLKVLPVWELFFNKLIEKSSPIATRKVKWDLNYRKKYGIQTGPAKNLLPEQEKKIFSLCRRAYRALNLNGYARMDLRMNSRGQIFLLEVNPNPDIGFGEEMAESAEFLGWDYKKLLSKILHLGLSYVYPH